DLRATTPMPPPPPPPVDAGTDAASDASPMGVMNDTGCSCATGGPPVSSIGLAIVVAVLLRRRR
ncbi:MAG: MYXO-CTERM sorting domain-containing protein, partial [Myxococcota bacterium]